jgi:CRP-like cAMP-binding protein
MQRRSVGADGPSRLANIPLFDGLSPGQLQMLARLLDEVVADTGEVLMAQGEQGFELIMIEEGSAEVLQNGERINLLGAGDFCGELAVLGDGAPRTATVTALVPLRGLLFTAHFLRTVHDRLPVVGERLRAAAGERRARDERAVGEDQPAG